MCNLLIRINHIRERYNKHNIHNGFGYFAYIHVKSRARFDLLLCLSLWCIPEAHIYLKRLQWPMWISYSCEHYSLHTQWLKAWCEETPSSLNTIWLRLVRNDCCWTSNMSACQSSHGQGHAYVSKPCLTFSRLEIIRGFCAHTQYFQRTIAGGRDQHWTKYRDIQQLLTNSDFN